MNSNHQDHTSGLVAPAKPRRASLPLIILATLFIVVPFLTWYGTWFGRKLSDEDIAQYLADDKNPRHVQHALSLIEERVEKGDVNVRKFYPQIVLLSTSPLAEIRKTTAWVMGQDNSSAEFHRALVVLLSDREPLVRRNAALQLVRFNDASGRPELRAMLQSFEAKSPMTGSIESLLPKGSAIKGGGLLARIRVSSGVVQEFRSPLDGTISALSTKEGDSISTGQTVAWLTPDHATITDALRALAYVGKKDDLPLIESTAQIDASPETAQLAALTAKAIRARPVQ
jgi:hypothetical protein